MRLAKLTLWSVAVALTLVACTRPDRIPPEVSLSAPAAGAEIVVGTAVTISGTASDAGGVASVAVFAADEELGKVVPGADGTWTLTWVPSQVGPVVLSAKATDKAGNSASTPEVTVTVVATPATTGSIAGIISRAAPDPDLDGDALAAAALREPARVVPGDVFVMFTPSVQSAMAAGGGALQAASVGQLSLRTDGGFAFGGTQFTLARTFPFTGGLSLYRASALGEEETRELVASLNRSPLVVEAFANRIRTTLAVPNDEFYEFQWHYEQLNLPEAWDIETGTTERVTVAILDTGRFNHTDLEWADGGANFAMWDGTAPATEEGPISNFYTNPGGNDHGTHVAGTVGALTNNSEGVAGVNWNVDLLPVKVMTAAGSGTDAGIIEGLIWLTGLDDPAYGGWVNTNIPRVVNISLGGLEIDGCPLAIDALFAHLASEGIYTVVAAGNEAAPSDYYGFGNCPSVITVGATGPTAMRAFYSNFGPFVDVMAPGGDFWATDPQAPSLFDGVLSTVDDDDYDFSIGTSMAAPHVAGVVSLMLAAEPDLTLEQIRTRLHNASVPLTAEECNVKVLGFEGLDLCGAGLLDAAAALRGDVVTTPSAFAYALPYVGGEAPDVRNSDLTSLELLARYKTEATANADGSFTYGLSGLEPGTYHVVALELRAPSSGISAIDRVGHQADVEVVAGGAAAADVTVVPLYTLR